MVAEVERCFTLRTDRSIERAEAWQACERNQPDSTEDVCADLLEKCPGLADAASAWNQ
ncbi:hypothetical protein [Nannocystis punicea]|uniref:Uncharacterized protein n=1 Tax=Nannocystis punicea TaxID=2995304 RepID=A0ABY7GT36_9BACT|nr:hypothetical protein [Nannocystis poenicansa]WAS90119.1 hypothetical protein O0S08_28325 [Nannocystis poenicansa]